MYTPLDFASSHNSIKSRRHYIISPLLYYILVSYLYHTWLCISSLNPSVPIIVLPLPTLSLGDDVGAEEPQVNLRPLSMADLKEAMKQVGASYGQDSHSMNDLRQWNDLYGEGGSRKVNKLSYFT